MSTARCTKNANNFEARMLLLGRLMARPRTSGILMLGLVACSSDEHAMMRPTADLRADANRDGEVTFDDDADDNDTEWSRRIGPIFLANIDDDAGRCVAETGDNDFTIARCNDAEDEIVNGEDDARDLARLKTRPGSQPADATGRLEITPEGAREVIRVFQKIGPGPADFRVVVGGATVFSHDELERGLELAIEARDIVRDAIRWDGYADVRLTVTSSSAGVATDTVRMRLAPVLTYHHLLPAETVWMPDIPTLRHERMHDDLQKACVAAGLGAPRTLAVADQWTQDFFEPAFTSMPGTGGTQHVMRVNYRSANVSDPDRKGRPLRDAGQVVFKLRGKDVAGIQQFDLSHDPEMDTLNSFGNWETVPPYEKDGVSFPFGRILRGSSIQFYPDRTFARMIEAQAQQPPIDIDTSWLYVGHVDETVSFVKAPTPRGWMLLANDPRLAKTMLEEAARAGHGDVPMFVGMTWLDVRVGTKPAEITIDEVLADPEIMEASAEAAVEVDAQIEILKRETGLRDDEIIRVPFLHSLQRSKSVAFQPALVNGLYTSDTHFAAPEPHGPVIGGQDIFKAQFAEALGRLGITVDWVEDWDAYHRIFGEVHCGTNATRRIPEERWWESGR
jgi:protein-arginine deiminase